MENPKHRTVRILNQIDKFIDCYKTLEGKHLARKRLLDAICLHLAANWSEQAEQTGGGGSAWPRRW